MQNEYQQLLYLGCIPELKPSSMYMLQKLHIFLKMDTKAIHFS